MQLVKVPVHILLSNPVIFKSQSNDSPSSPQPCLVDQKLLVVAIFWKRKSKAWLSTIQTQLGFQPYLPTASWHLPNVTWTTWNSPDNLKIPHAFSLCWCRSIVCKVLPTSFQAHLILFTDNATCHIHSYFVFMARSSLMHCLVRSLRASFIPMEEYLAHGTISINKHLDKFSVTADIEPDAGIQMWTRHSPSPDGFLKSDEHSRGTRKGRRDLFMEGWPRMGKWGLTGYDTWIEHQKKE